MNYRVHVYMTVRVPLDDIEAKSHEAAIAIARERAPVSFRDMAELGAESAEDITGFLVDEGGDEEFERSIPYDADGKCPPDYAAAAEAFHASVRVHNFGAR